MFINNIIFSTIFLISTISAQQQGEPSYNDKIPSETNSYTIKDVLGEGAFGRVYSVEDKEGKPFALKWYKGNDSSNVFMQIFGDMEREFAHGQLFHHPNIIKSHELFPDASKQNYYLVLDLVKGSTVRATPRKTIEEENALSASRQVMESLKYAYELGYLYLDMHDGNFMLEGNKDFKVIDLAGFFTWDELQSAMFPNYYTKKIDQKFSPKRAAILKRFIKEHPSKIIPKEYNSQFFQKWKEAYESFYFSLITNLVVSIINKASLDRDKKLDLRSKIERIAWEFEEDIADQTPTAPLSHYFDKISLILK